VQPGVLQRLLRAGALRGVGGEQVGEEVQEGVVRLRHAVAEGGALGEQQLVPGGARWVGGWVGGWMGGWVGSG